MSPDVVIVLRRNGRIATYYRDLRQGLEKAFRNALAKKQLAEAENPGAEFALSVEELANVIDEIILATTGAKQ